MLYIILYIYICIYTHTRTHTSLSLSLYVYIYIYNIAHNICCVGTLQLSPPLIGLSSLCSSGDRVCRIGNKVLIQLLDYTILYYTILYYTVLYYTVLYYTILYYTILQYTLLFVLSLLSLSLWCPGTFGNTYLTGVPNSISVQQHEICSGPINVHIIMNIVIVFISMFVIDCCLLHMQWSHKSSGKFFQV